MPLTRKERHDQRKYKRQVTGERMVVVAVNGSLHNSIGQVYCRDLGGIEEGSTSILNPPKAIDCTSQTIIRKGRIVIVKEDHDGRLYIDGNDRVDIQQAGISQRVFNQLDDANRYKHTGIIGDLQTFPTGGDGTVKVFSGTYRKTDGTYANFAGATSIDLLTSYKPSTANYQRIVCLWIDEDTNSVVITQSSELSQSTNLKNDIATAMTYINEAAASAPVRGVGIGTYILKYEDTEITEKNKFKDLRPFITAYSKVGSGSNVIVNSSTIPSGKDAFFAGGITITGGLTVEGEMYIL